MSTKCKAYPEQSGKWRVWLYWEGKRYNRGYYDERIDWLDDRLAKRLCEAINADIDNKGENFDPLDWFRSSREYCFDHAIEKWLDSKAITIATYRSYKKSVEYCVQFFGSMNIKTIRKAHVKKFIESLPKHLSANTKTKHLRCLKAALNEICDDWHLMRIRFPSITVPYKKKKWLRRDVQAQVIKQIPVGDRPVFWFMVFTGVRPTEACALQWRDINFDTDIITVSRSLAREQTKTGFYREIALTEDILSILPERGLGKASVFLNSIGNHYQPQSLWKIYNKARAEITNATLYEFVRHSKNSQLKEAGYDIYEIQKFMGHRSMSSTEIYTHFDAKKGKEMVG